MNGRYTINPKGTGVRNFLTIKSAIDSLNKVGINASTQIKIANGIYVSSSGYSIGNINGTSATNQIIIEGDSNKIGNVVISVPSSNASSTSGNYVFQLNGTGFLTLRYLTINRPGKKTEGSAIEIKGGSHYCLIDSNRISATSYNDYNNSRAIYSETDIDSFITITHNHISNGYQSIYLSSGSNSANFETGNIISNNIIDSGFNYQILCYYQNGLKFDYNQVGQVRSIYGGGRGFSCFYGQDSLRIRGNRFNMSAGSLGIELIYSNTNFDSIEISNNSISIKGFTSLRAYGILSYQNGSNPYINIYNNDFYINNYNSGGYCTYMVGCIWNDINNIYYNTTGGVSNYGGTINRSDYNDIYAPYSLIKFPTGMGIHNISLNPKFIDTIPNNLVATNKFLISGTPVPRIEIDINKHKRSLLRPTIGNTELVINKTEVLVVLKSPKNFCQGNWDIELTLFNLGSDTIYSIPLKYSYDGGKIFLRKNIILKNPIGFIDSVTIRLGSLKFKNDSEVNLYTYIDTINGTNYIKIPDTFKVKISPSLNGNYTINPKGSGLRNFSSFSKAISALNSLGICGPVIFKVSNHKYTEQLVLPRIPGSSKINTITFIGNTKDSNLVIIDYPIAKRISEDSNYTINFKGTHYVTFKNITITASGPIGTSFTPLGNIINFESTSAFDSIISCVVKTLQIKNTNWNTANCVFANYNASVFNLCFDKTLFKGGFGCLFFGGSNLLSSSGFFISNSIFDSAFAFAIGLGYADSSTILKNTIKNIMIPYGYGIYINARGVGSKIIKNKILMVNSGYNLYLEGSASDSTVITNNFLMLASSTGSNINLLANNASNIRFVNNSILNKGLDTTILGTHGIYAYSYFPPSNFWVVNNIFYMTIGKTNYGSPFYQPNLFKNYGITNEDFNDLYSSNTKGLVAANTAYSGLGVNDIEINPNFSNSSSKPFDLHISGSNKSLTLNSDKTVFVNDDIDGQKRVAYSLGADEIIDTSLNPKILLSADTVCLGTKTEFNNKSINYDSIKIIFDSTHHISVIYNSNIFFQFTTSGVHKVKAFSYYGKKIDSTIILVNVLPFPQASLRIDSTCNNLEISLKDSSIGNKKVIVYFNPTDSIELKSNTRYYHKFPSPGKYKIKVFTSNGICDDSSFNFINVHSIPSYKISVMNDSLNPFRIKVNFVDSTLITKYYIDFGDSYKDSSNFYKSFFHSYTKNGIYNITSIVKRNGCIYTNSQKYTINFTSNNDLYQNNIDRISILQNPVVSHLNIQIDGQQKNRMLKLMTSQGQILINSIIRQNKFSLDMTNFCNGLYFLNIDGNTIQFIKE